MTETVKGVAPDWIIGNTKYRRDLRSVRLAYAGEGDLGHDYEADLGGGKVRYTWDLTTYAKTDANDKFLVRCEYNRTNTLLLKHIPPGMKTCRVTTKEDHGITTGNVMECW